MVERSDEQCPHRKGGPEVTPVHRWERNNGRLNPTEIDPRRQKLDPGLRRAVPFPKPICMCGWDVVW